MGYPCLCNIGQYSISEVSAFVQTAQDGTLTIAWKCFNFIIVGFGFKLGAVPFHMWIQIFIKARDHVTLFIASAPKVSRLWDGLPVAP